MPNDVIESAGQLPPLTIATVSRSSFLDLIRDPILFFRRLGDQRSSIAEIDLTLRRFYLVSEPEMIRELLMTRSDQFEKFPRIDPDKGLFGTGLLTSEAGIHRAQRRMMQPGFHRDRLKRYAGQMIGSTANMMAEWSGGSTVDVMAAMNGLALDIVTRSLFSMEDFALARETASHVETILHSVNQLVMPWGDLLLRLPLPSSRRYQASRRRLDEIVYGLIADAVQSNRERDDLFGLLLDAADPETGKPLSTLEIRDQIVTLIVAGHETVATGLTWCLYLLARHPGRQEALAGAIEAAIGHREIGLDDYAALAGVEHAFMEAMRLYPPIWILGRRALTGYSFGEFHAKRGGVFLVCMANLHRSVRWFQDPDEFQPERWRSLDLPNYVYMPFGGGLRRCIGERFAWMEGVFCLASMLRNWRFEPVDSAEPKPAAKLTLRPSRPVRLRITKRG